MSLSSIFGKNKATNIAGGGGWLATLALLVKCLVGGHLDIMCVIAVIFGGSVSTGLFFAKDKDATGGSIPLTKEAEARVKGHKSDPSEKS